MKESMILRKRPKMDGKFDPRYTGNIFADLFFTQLSLAIEEAEKFIITVLNKVELDDAAAMDVVEKFTAQESIHRGAHHFLNAQIDGFYQSRILASIDEFFYKKVFGSVPSLSLQLALAASFEHFTGSVLEIMGKNFDFFRKMAPDQKAIWWWHALEEYEHAEVAYFLFTTHMKNNQASIYVYRLSAMLFFLAVMSVKAPTKIGIMAYKDRLLFKTRFYRDMASFLLFKEQVLFGIGQQVLTFFHPRFSPDKMKLDPEKLDEIKAYVASLNLTR